MVWFVFALAMLALIIAIAALCAPSGECEPLRKRVGTLESELEAHKRRLNYHVASASELGELRRELRALATALGYEWVPEGKTKAEWRRKGADFKLRTDHYIDDTPLEDVRLRMRSTYPPAAPKHNRRKGDRKKGGK